MNYDNIDNELGNTNISLSDTTEVSSSKTSKISKEENGQSKDRNKTSEEDSGKDSIFSTLFRSKKKEIAMGLISSAKSRSQKWYEKLLCDFKFLDPFFEIKYTEVKSRAINGFIPFNRGFIDIKPDLYGPFWIYTTIIFLVSACGSFINILTESFDTGSSFVELIPKAAFLVSI